MENLLCYKHSTNAKDADVHDMDKICALMDNTPINK